MSVPSTYFDVVNKVIESTAITPEDKRALLADMRKSSPTSDRLTFRLAIMLIGLIALVTIGGICFLLQAGNVELPDGLIAIASAAVGGLAGLLSQSRASNEDAC